MMKSVTKRKGLLIVGTSLLALQAAPAFAQDRSKEPVTVEDVVVTAQRRVEANIDVPIAITAIGAEEIQNIGAGYMTDIGFKAPNVFMSGGSISPSISIRGVSSQSNINAGFPPAVGVYVDEVYQGRDPTFNTILNDVERVEVLRGPQGTLYGKNTIGGAINITTTQPSNDFTAFGDVNVGNLGLLQFRATVGGALIEDTLMARLSVVHRQRDGWLTNALTGDKLNDTEANGVRLVVASQISDALRFTLSADVFDESGTSALETGPVVLSAAVPAFAAVPAQNPNDNIVQLNSPEFAERTLYGASGRFDYEMDGMALTSITAYRKYNSNFNDDSDGLQLDAFNVGREENTNNFSQELRLTSTGETRLTWLVGAYFYTENIENNRRISIGPDMPKMLGGPAAGLYWPGYTGERGLTASTIDSTSWALFGSITYDVTERVHAALGLRWTDEEKDFAYSQTTPVIYTAGPGGSIARQFAVLINPRTEDYSDARLTGDASLSFDFSDDAVGYVKYSRGFKAGGFQTDVISPPFSPVDDFGFKPETVNNYELGIKSYLFSRKVSLNAAVFYLDWKDKQEQIFTGLSFLIRNAATASSRGAELELTARPTRNLTLDANVAYLDTRYDEFPGSTLAGKHFPGLPEWSGSAGLQYIAPLGGTMELFARADVIYRGDTYTQPNATSTQVNEALTTFNGRLGLQSAEGGWGAYLWGKNLTDEIVVGSGSAFPFPFANITTRSPGFGKTYGVELRKKF